MSEQKFKEHFMDPNGIDKVPFYFTGNSTDFKHAPVLCLEGPNPEADKLELKKEAAEKAKISKKRRLARVASKALLTPQKPLIS